MNNDQRLKHKEKNEDRNIKAYWPLLSLILISIAAALALTRNNANFMAWMHYYMGFFLCCFAMLKIFHPIDFADGFQMYDILAKRLRTYAYFYPLIELSLGLSYLSFYQPVTVYFITFIVFGFSTIGVVSALKRGLDIKCVCMGTILDVPLSTVTLTENVIMVIMSFFMLLISI